jgi:hypothetical protein
MIKKNLVRIEEPIQKTADDFHANYNDRYGNVSLKIDKLDEEFKTISDHINYSEVDLDDYSEEMLERFIYMFYIQKKWIFSRIKSTLLPEIKRIIDLDPLYDYEDTEKIARKYLGQYIWPKIIEKNNLAQKALDLIDQQYYMEGGMCYKGQREGLSKVDSVKLDMYKYSEEINYDQFKFAYN